MTVQQGEGRCLPAPSRPWMSRKCSRSRGGRPSGTSATAARARAPDGWRHALLPARNSTTDMHNPVQAPAVQAPAEPLKKRVRGSARRVANTGGGGGSHAAARRAAERNTTTIAGMVFCRARSTHRHRRRGRQSTRLSAGCARRRLIPRHGGTAGAWGAGAWGGRAGWRAPTLPGQVGLISPCRARSSALLETRCPRQLPAPSTMSQALSSRVAFKAQTARPAR